jgi:RND family efflux transporter MFP subunit
VRMLAGKDNYERYVAAGEGVSKSQVENALSRYESERAMLARSERTVEQARIQLSWCSVKAPREGLLLSRRVETGDLVNAGSVLFEIGDTSRMKVVFGVPSSLVEHIEQGTKLRLVVSDLSERGYEGPVTQISPSADPTSRVFDVEVTVDNADGALRVGMIATLELPPSVAAEARPVVSVPLDAIVRPPSDSTGFAVYVPDPNVSAAEAGSKGTACVARLRRVELGRVRRDQVEVREGLAVGERVIVRGSTIVQAGSAIRIIP